ncbi:uncharacterized protein [Rutidosis leptorrhynchoides]|uniref:uncharacterized protein n=1 Tax=Rutidosis leptorrhynchoides TaxID=125765 RepID=UPI003A99370E
MIIDEVHNSSCALHSGYKTIGEKIMRMGYFWPSLYRDVAKIVKRCKSCQRHAPQNRMPRHDMIPVNSPWPFHKWAIDIVGPFSAGPGNVKFLIVAIDYFTKWVEAKAVRTIIEVQVRNFVWENIVCKFGIPRGLANGLCEVTNRDIVNGIKKRLYEKRTGWVDELPNVLWAQNTTFKKSIGETHFSLVYGSEAVIPAEILVPTHRVTNFDEEVNGEALHENLNLVEERRLMAAIREANNKHQIAKYYNKRVRALSFDIGE